MSSYTVTCSVLLRAKMCGRLKWTNKMCSTISLECYNIITNRGCNIYFSGYHGKCFYDTNSEKNVVNTDNDLAIFTNITNSVTYGVYPVGKYEGKQY